MNLEKSDNWYVIQTKPSQEDLASFNLFSLGLEILNPKLKTIKCVWGLPKPIIKPLFAGYIFAKFNAVSYFHTIQYTRGVKQVLHFGKTLFPIEEEIIQNIKNRLNSEGFVESEKNILKPGITVSISEGPLSGFNGIFERETSDKKRVIILLDMMGVRAQVEMEKYYLKSAA